MIVFGGKSSIGYYKVLFWKKLFSINKKYLLLLDEKHSGKKYIFWSNILVSEIHTCYGCHNTNFEEIHWFSEIYTSFGLQKYQFWRNTVITSIHTCFGGQHLLFNKAFRKIYLHGQPIIFKSMLYYIFHKKKLLLFNQLLLQW